MTEGVRRPGQAALGEVVPAATSYIGFCDQLQLSDQAIWILRLSGFERMA